MDLGFCTFDSFMIGLNDEATIGRCNMDLSSKIFKSSIESVPTEAAIGLAILVVFFRNKSSIAVEDVNQMKG